jgi:ribose/xylose/arabinose/galactoside ABC-type transport system permease subunit
MATEQPQKPQAISPVRGVIDALRGRRGAAPEYMGLLAIVAGLCIYFSATQSLFASGDNVQNLARQASVLAMLAAGQIFVILAGGIDISVGGQVSLLSIVAVVLSKHMPLPLGLALTVLVGCAVGLINGLLVAFVRI